MNDDYEEEEYEEDEYEQETESYDTSNRGGNNQKTGNIAVDAKNEIKKAGKQAVKNTGKVALAMLKKIFVILITNPWILAVLAGIIIAAMIWLIITEKLSKDVTSSVEDYINTDSGKNIDENVKALYNERGSLLLIKLTDINAMYDQYIKNKKNDLQKNMTIVVGKSEVETKKATAPTQNNGGTSSNTGGTNIKFEATSSDGIRNDERLKIITGSTQLIENYKNDEGFYVWIDGKVGNIEVKLDTIDVPVWDNKSGTKIATSTSVKVNSKIATEVLNMFSDIFNDPSKPVINTLGGFRGTQSDMTNNKHPTHPFGVAVDINAEFNPMGVGEANMGSYTPGTNELSMDANHPIVKIIRDKYGWNWGGDWKSKKDYMHFSYIGG